MPDDFSVADTVVLPCPRNGSFEWKALGHRDVFPHDILQLGTLVELPTKGGEHLAAPPPPSKAVGASHTAKLGGWGWGAKPQATAQRI